MAKPITVAPTTANRASSSASPSTHTLDTPTRPRRRRKPTTAAHALAPSSTLLSLLSALASSSVAAGTPAPPAFLCPSAIQPPPPPPLHIPTKRKAKRAGRTLTTTSASSVSRAKQRDIVDKYEQGDDGIWRRVQSYSFYGVCAGCSATPVSAIDDAISRPKGDDVDDMDSTTPFASESIASQPPKLPPGWEPKEHRWGHESRRTLVLAISLVLTFVICILIIACLFWRRSMRKKMRERDIERKGKGRRRNRQLRAEEAKEAAREKEAKSKQKLWARATARWREQARMTARHRRGKRTSIRSKSNRSSITRDDYDSDSRSHTSSSGRTSPTPSTTSRTSRDRCRRVSTESPPTPEESANLSSSQPQQQEVTPAAPPPTISLSPPPVPPPSSPPAYQQKASRGEPPANGVYHAVELASTSSQLISPRRPSHSSFVDRSEIEESEGLSSIPAAHVATDDKAVLARLASLASAPPTEEDEASSGQQEVVVSAPEWREEEEMEQLIAQTEEATGTGAGAAGCAQEASEACESTSPTGTSPFPPPPSKGNLIAPNFYDYPYAFEEMDLGGMVIGPSAPPFQEMPSAPAVEGEDLQLQASAPPLMEDDGFEEFYGQEATAPSASDLQEEEAENTITHGVTGDDDTMPTRTTAMQGEQRLPDYHP